MLTCSVCCVARWYGMVNVWCVVWCVRMLQHDNLKHVLSYLTPGSADIYFVCKYWTAVIKKK